MNIHRCTERLRHVGKFARCASFDRKENTQFCDVKRFIQVTFVFQRVIYIFDRTVYIQRIFYIFITTAAPFL